MEDIQPIGRFLHPCPTEDELISLANRPVLENWEMAALIQGFRPVLKVGRGEITYLDEYADSINKLINAEKSGDLSFPIQPQQMLIWCIKNEIPLPEIFEQTIRSKFFRHRKPKKNTAFTDELLRGSDQDYQRFDIKRGRKKQKSTTSIRGYEAEISYLVSELVLKYIKENGKRPSKKSINTQLAKKTKRNERDIDRTYAINNLITPALEKKAKHIYREKIQLGQEMKNKS